MLQDPALGRTERGDVPLGWLLGLLAMLAVVPLYLPRARGRRRFATGGARPARHAPPRLTGTGRTAGRHPVARDEDDS